MPFITKFLVDQKWSAAGECYQKASSIQMTKLDNKHEAAQNLVEAGNCWRKAEPKRATECLAEAIEGKLSKVILSELLCSLHRSGSCISCGQTACYNR